MITILFKQEERGQANHGWLLAKHSFSFASYHDPLKVNFGALRVLNDDRIAPKMGFGQHPHENMEIITIPLTGSLRHKDSMGHEAVIEAGEIQVMSAGTGIYHSEFNDSTTDDLTLFQLWIFPNSQNVTPRYGQQKITLTKNVWTQLISPNSNDDGQWIHQDAWVHMTELSENTELEYTFKGMNHGAFLMVVEGEIMLENTILQPRDAIGITNTQVFSLKSNKESKLLLIEVPLQF